MSSTDSRSGDGGEVEPASSLPTESRVFGAMGVFSLFLAIAYGIFSGPEWAGLAALTAAGIFGVALGVFFAKDLRRVQTDVARAERTDGPAGPPATTTVEPDGPDELFLPSTSIWPFFLALGAVLTVAGLAMGFWFLLPGVALLVHALIGFATQSRRRSAH